MGNTRTKILDILRRRREATVEYLTQALHLAPATLRRHLDILQRDGYVTARPVRRATGRPHYSFSITEAGEALFPRRYVHLASMLLEEIAELSSGDTAGKAGREIAALMLERMTERLADDLASRLPAGSLGERVTQVAALLTDEGISLDVKQTSGGYLLIG